MVTAVALTIGGGAPAFSEENPTEPISVYPVTATEEVIGTIETEFPGSITTSDIEVKTDVSGLTVDTPVETEEGEQETEVGVNVPLNPSLPISAGSDIQIRLPEPLADSSSSIEQESVVHTDLYASTDAIVTPTSEQGLEIFYLLQDSLAPTSFDTEVILPEGTSLVEIDDQQIRLNDLAGATYMLVTAPWAKDANGVDVPIRIDAEGSRVTTSVTLPADVAYPVLVDPTFTTHGDNVHRTKNDDGTIVASGHGWWNLADNCGCLTSNSLADVNVKLYNYWDGSWHMVQSTTKQVKPGGGSARRANARDVCSLTGGTYQWYSVIEVDVVGYADPVQPITTPMVFINCRA